MEIGSMTVTDDIILLYYATLHPTLATYDDNSSRILTYSGTRALIGNRPREMKGPSDNQYDWVAVGAGRRTIGQLAGHTIHLEIEEVFEKNRRI